MPGYDVVVTSFIAATNRKPQLDRRIPAPRQFEAKTTRNKTTLHENVKSLHRNVKIEPQISYLAVYQGGKEKLI